MSDPRTILIVDDDEHFRRALRYHLEFQGYDVVEAEDGVDAMAQLRTLSCDVIITDYRMPRMDGLELLASIRRDNRKIAVLLVSGAIDDDEERRARACGATSVLRKPLDRWHLLAALRAALHSGVQAL